MAHCDLENLEIVMRCALVAEATAIMRFAENSVDIKAMMQAAQAINAAPGLLIVSGIGKSGHIARKMASTFSSLGRPSAFLHAAEASHGDLGVVQKGSIVLVLSNTGETTELSDLLHYCKTQGIDMIAITGRSESTLARAARLSIVYGPVEEVCPNGLAPTTSTTLALAIGDALAIAIAHLRGVVAQDFRRYHPGGRLGARLLRVEEIMLTGTQLPIVPPDASMEEVAAEISAKALGTAIVLRPDGTVAGIITDGDIRRRGVAAWSMKAGDIATPRPISVSPTTRALEVLDLMNTKRITQCLVADENGYLLGLVHMHQCLKANVGV